MTPWQSLLVLAATALVFHRLWAREIRARLAVEADNDRLRRRLTRALDRADEADEAARQALAREDEAYVELQRHAARCLGERVDWTHERRH